jgi:hypothetical protein
MNDPTESIRRHMIATALPAEQEPGPHYNTQELQEAFEVHGFLAPFVSVTRKADGVKGTMRFTHSPRAYFDFQPEK